MQNKADKQRKTEKPVEIRKDCQENQACYWHGRVKFGNRGGEPQKSALLPGVTMPAPGFPSIDNGDSLTKEMESKSVSG